MSSLRSLLSRLLPAGAALLCGLSPAAAQTSLIRKVSDARSDTHIEVTALFSAPSPGGFLPVRVTINNPLAAERSALLSFDASSGFGQGVRSTSTFPFSAPPGKTVTRDILVPIHPRNGSYMSSSVQVEVRMSGSFGEEYASLDAAYDTSQPAVLLSEALHTPNGSALDAEASSRYAGSTFRGSGLQFSARFDPKQLPDDWLAFSGYDSVMLTDGDWSQLPAGARNALLSWVRLGGRLVLFSAADSTAAAFGIRDTGYGSVAIESLPADFKLDPGKTVDLVTKANPLDPRHQSIAGHYRSTWPLLVNFGAKAFQYGIFLLVLFAFGILVGPVNLFVFAKAGRRHRLFITTPLISLGASLILVALIILQDGFGGAGHRRILMEVRPDGGQNAAYLHQEQFARTGILSSSSFPLDPAAALTPVTLSESRWTRFTDQYRLTGRFNLRADGSTRQASGDWFQSRSEHGHLLSAVLSTRGRIERGNSPEEILSTFDFPIDHLFLLAPDGSWSHATNVQTGRSTRLTPADAQAVRKQLDTEAGRFAARQREMFQTASRRPGHYVALTRHAPGVETLPSIRWKQTHTVLTGPLAP